MKTPDEEVAGRIIQKLREAGLLSETGLNKLYPSLVAGKVKTEDWKFFFETDRVDAEGADDRQDQ